MPQPRRTPYVSVNLRPEARDALQDGAVQITTPAGRRVSLSETLLAALRVARAHPDEWVESLTDITTEETS